MMDEVVKDFVAETYESLENLEQIILKIEGDATNEESIRDAFRLLHTVKGTCGFLGFVRMQAVAHRAENVLSKMRDGELIADEFITSTLFVALDAIRQITDHIDAKGVESSGNDEDLLQALDKCLHSPGGSPDTSPSTQNEGGEAEDVDASLQSLLESANRDEPQKESPKDSEPIKPQLDDPPPPENTVSAKSTSSTSSSQTIRIHLDVVDHLMALVGELVLTRNQLLQQNDQDQNNAQSNVLTRLSHLTSELQQNIMKTRMQAIENAWTKIPRIVRDMSTQLGKKIQLKQEGAETELDRQVIELIKDPLVHMIRNSADHGIEAPHVRIAAGKPETGTITLKAYHHGGHIVIEIDDDGKGIDPKIIRKKALEKGVITESENERLSDDQSLQLIFKPGFSTAETISNVSGRGVGMDVVRTNIDKLGGSIEMHSNTGKGSRFVMKIPLTLSIISVLIVRVQNQLFALPQLAITEILRLNIRNHPLVKHIKGIPVLRWRNHLIPLVYIADLLNIQADDASLHHNIIIVQVGSQHFGFVVDSIHDSQEIVVKPLSKKLSHLTIFSGSTILGTGDVVLILDPNNFNLTQDMPKGSSAPGEGTQKLTQKNKDTLILLFKLKGEMRAVPLALVGRIDEILAHDIQYVGEKYVFSHRGELIPVVGFDPSQTKADDPVPVLIFVDRGYKFALQIEEIVDIVEDSTEIQLESSEDGTLGTAVINGKPTTIIDSQSYFKRVYSQWNETRGHRNIPKAQHHLLLVDDSLFFLNLISPLLKISGYFVETATSADQGLQMALNATRPFDIIISDIEMPDKNGYDFLKDIKAQPSLSNTPVIALSGCDTETELARAQSAGFKEFVPKTDQQNLIRVLTQLCG